MKDESEDRSQRRARHDAADPNGLVPSGAWQDSAGAGDMGAGSGRDDWERYVRRERTRHVRRLNFHFQSPLASREGIFPCRSQSQAGILDSKPPGIWRMSVQVFGESRPSRSGSRGRAASLAGLGLPLPMCIAGTRRGEKPAELALTDTRLYKRRASRSHRARPAAEFAVR
jgi:hypothetical protein